jgi:DNA-binding response OmpR family regulator
MMKAMASSDAPRILVVDDDRTTLTLVERMLTRHDMHVAAFADPKDALDSFAHQDYDLVLSDYFMPEMNGQELMSALRDIDPFVPLVFLTANEDMRIAIELVKSGADDYITKPVVEDDLLFRIQKTMREKEQQRQIERIEKEREILRLEHEKLVNWRALYASKDIHQTEQMIDLLSRTINQAGGFMWVDLLRMTAEPIDDENVKVSQGLVDTILTSATSQKEIFDYITFISRVDTFDLEIERHELDILVPRIQSFLETELAALCTRHDRVPHVMPSGDTLQGAVAVDEAYLKRIIHELLVNAVKYSPPGSRVAACVEISSSQAGGIDITVRNSPKAARARDTSGERIFGIPYDYSELVFDLFYTIEGFPTSLEEEEWGDGTGLYVCRKVIQRMNGCITTGNGVDYTGETPEPFIRFTVTIPSAEQSQSSLNGCTDTERNETYGR